MTTKDRKQKEPKTAETTRKSTAAKATAGARPSTATTTGAAATAAANQDLVETVRTIWLQSLRSQVAAAEALETETVRLTKLATSVIPFTPAPVQQALVEAAEKGTTLTRQYRQDLIKAAETPWTTESPAKTASNTATTAGRTAIDLALRQLTVAENLTSTLQVSLDRTATESWARVRKDVPEPYATAFESFQRVQASGTKAVAETVAFATKNARTALQAVQSHLGKTP